MSEKGPLMDHSSTGSISTKTGSSLLTRPRLWAFFSGQIDQDGEAHLPADRKAHGDHARVDPAKGNRNPTHPELDDHVHSDDDLLRLRCRALLSL